MGAEKSGQVPSGSCEWMEVVGMGTKAATHPYQQDVPPKMVEKDGQTAANKGEATAAEKVATKGATKKSGNNKNSVYVDAPSGRLECHPGRQNRDRDLEGGRVIVAWLM